MKHWKKSSKIIGGILAIAAAVGLLASFALLHETVAVLENPEYNPSCNISPLVSCSSVMSEPESQILGMPFAVFGVAGFTALLTFAILLMAGTRVKEWVWLAGIGAAVVGLLGTLYLYLLSLFSYGSICPWCFTTWITTIAVFWALVTHVFAAKLARIPDSWKAFAQWWVASAPMILIGWYVLLIFSIVLYFKDSLL